MKNFKTFKFPYIFVDDTKGKYQPLYKEYSKSIPRLNLNSAVLGCPFMPERKRKNENKSNKPKKTKTKVKYCEICCSKFTNYIAHINSSMHKSFGMDNCNYKDIDNFVLDMKNVCFTESQLQQSPCKTLENVYASSYQQNSFNSFIKFSKVESDCDSPNTTTILDVKAINDMFKNK